MSIRFFRFITADCVAGATAGSTFTQLGDDLWEALPALLESGCVVEIAQDEWERSDF
jgi:hypothetical protein